MYPVLFRIGSFEITTFGVMVAIGALVGLWIFRRELARSGLTDDIADAAILGLIGGLVGAKLLYAFEHLGEEPFLSLVLSRAGMSWFGGFVGGVGAGLGLMRLRRWPVLATLAAAAPALAVGHAIGRIGCFLVGDDYGRATSLPWGVAFPEGLPPTRERVHPTQLYEMAVLFVLAWFLVRWRKRGVSDRVVLGLYLAIAGAERFLIEFIRINVRVALGLTVAQFASLALVAVGVVLIAGGRAAAPAPAPTRARRRARK
jgi:phosphatidylglycerol:prolipoprotein diacylglycerol transferase